MKSYLSLVWAALRNKAILHKVEFGPECASVREMIHISNCTIRDSSYGVRVEER